MCVIFTTWHTPTADHLTDYVVSLITLTLFLQCPFHKFKLLLSKTILAKQRCSYKQILKPPATILS